jgi:hypothetical protein
MKLIHILSVLALALTIVPPVLFATGQLGENSMKLTMLVGAVLWFATAPRWLHGGES